MKKTLAIFTIIILTSITSFAQVAKTGSEVNKKFKNGACTVSLVENIYVSFLADFDTVDYDDDDNITYGIFYLTDNYDIQKAGKEWFIKEYDDEVGNLTLFTFFNDKCNIVLGDKVETDGKVGFKMYIN